MSWCECRYDCGIAQGYELEIWNGQNCAEKKVIQREYRGKCRDKHEGCELREILISRTEKANERKKMIRKIFIKEGNEVVVVKIKGDPSKRGLINIV